MEGSDIRQQEMGNVACLRDWTQSYLMCGTTYLCSSVYIHADRALTRSPKAGRSVNFHLNLA